MNSRVVNLFFSFKNYFAFEIKKQVNSYNLRIILFFISKLCWSVRPWVILAEKRENRVPLCRSARTHKVQ